MTAFREHNKSPVHISDQTFDDWVRQYQRLLFGIAYWWTGSRTDAEELTQEAFFQAYRSRSSLREIEAVKGWLVSILRHCFSQMYRKGNSRMEIPLDEVMEKFGETTDLRSDEADPHEFLAIRQALANFGWDPVDALPQASGIFLWVSYALRARPCGPASVSD